ncbi:hypothetical protein MmiHf6_02230 [Methanimicrococcus hongohii]|uniref:Uncharacterized protein n=2 Tax=Methanimicrococcus hongohii TaxID=3028295 RepID=A0AA96UYX1_9EURY|nr:hypothetical protein MmiHf6_02230 [Methanimicrococcus sp. Hf6]
MLPMGGRFMLPMGGRLLFPSGGRFPFPVGGRFASESDEASQAGRFAAAAQAAACRRPREPHKL